MQSSHVAIFRSTVLENQSTARWMGNPKGFILSKPSQCHTSFGLCVTWTLRARKKHKRFAAIIYRHHLQIKLVLFCHSVKLSSGSKCLAIRWARSILISHTIFNENSFWLSACIYLFTSKTQQIEAPYLASLLSLMQN